MLRARTAEAHNVYRVPSAPFWREFSRASLMRAYASPIYGLWFGRWGSASGFEGDHHVFHREGVRDIINVQPQRDGLAKPYQVRQVRGIIVKYGLAGGTDD